MDFPRLVKLVVRRLLKLCALPYRWHTLGRLLGSRRPRKGPYPRPGQKDATAVNVHPHRIVPPDAEAQLFTLRLMNEYVPSQPST
jgi:hypothetical protein